MNRFWALILSLVLFLSLLTSCDANETNETESVTSHNQEAQTEKDPTANTQTEIKAETEIQETDIAESNPETETPSEEYNSAFDIVCGTYIRENERDLYGYFTISLGTDGTFSYYETLISSYVGMGQYTVEGNIITLVDEKAPYYDDEEKIFVFNTHIFKFEYRDGSLIFLASESDSFMYINLPDGAEFRCDAT